MKRFVFLAAALLMPISARSVEALPIVSAPSVAAGVGDLVTIPISIAEAIDVSSWQFDLSFDPTVVQAVSVEEGPFMSDFGMTLFSPGVIDNTTGLISLVTSAFADLPPSPSGAGVLATIHFLALAPGVSALTVSNVFVNLLQAEIDVASGQITVTGTPPAAVPEPATLALLAAGLICLRTRRSAARGAMLMLACGLIAMLPASSEAQTTAPGPYYALPAWDQSLPAATRFIVLSNFDSAAVLDRETGLVWERAPNPANGAGVSWFEARNQCLVLTTGNRRGWRLPTLEELMSLFDPSTAGAVKLPGGHPFQGIHAGPYWTATSSVESAGFFWSATFDGFESGPLPPLTDISLWCVRGGSGRPSQ